MASVEDLKIDLPAPTRVTRKPRSSWLAYLILAVLLGAVGLWFVRRPVGNGPGAVSVHTVAPPSAGGGESGELTAGGYLEVIPPGPVVVSTLVEGRVASIDAVEGQRVAAGQVVARLDDSLHRQDVKTREMNVLLFRAKLKRQEAGFRTEEVDQAKADLERVRARLRLARQRNARNVRLVREGVVARADLEASQAEVRMAEAEVAARTSEHDLRTEGSRKEDIAIARAELAAMEAELNQAQWRVEACLLKAPVAGVVLERFVQPGDWVSPRMSPSNQRERPSSVVSVLDPKRIHAWVDVNQRDIGRVAVGQEARLATDARPERPVPGRVSRILPKANLQKNTVRVNVEVPGPPEDFRPEMSVKLSFLVKERQPAAAAGLVVPTAAVVRDASGASVFVVAGGRVRRRPVTVVTQTPSETTLASGVAAGDQIVLRPDGLTEGQSVETQR